MIRWSYKIAEPWRIGVYVHATMALLVLWVGLAGWRSGGSVLAVLESLAFVCALFVCVVLHELGHALAARRFGIATLDIVLLPIGGVARLERMPERPSQELIVALAGPAVNVAIVLLLWIWLVLSGALVPLHQVGLTVGPFLERLLGLNIVLIVFNLLPAFPMDGGRVLRALLAMRLDRLRATRIAAAVGKIMAVLFAAVGFFFNPFLMLIALFVWSGASREEAFTIASLQRRQNRDPTGLLSPEDRLRLLARLDAQPGEAHSTDRFGTERWRRER